MTPEPVASIEEASPVPVLTPPSNGAPMPRGSGLPFVVYLLALGTFLTSTTEFIIAGLLTEMSADFGVNLSTVGLLITAFAVGMIVGAPVMAVATLRFPRRTTLVLALLVFAAGHVMAALSSSIEVVMLARVVTALVTGAFWSVASVVATTAAGPALSSRALGVMMSGVGLATVFGVPLGSFAGQHVGWRGAFWALAALAIMAAAVIARFVPLEEAPETPRIRAEVAALRTRRLWLVLAATVLVTGGYMATFSFISPLLTERSGLSLSLVPLALVGFGVGALVGTNLGGRLADRNPVATFLASALGSLVVLLLVIALSGNPLVAIALIVLLGVTGMSVPPVATGLAVRYASAAPTLAAALTVSAFNLGIAIGSWAAGLALDSSLGATGPAVIGVGAVVLGLVPLVRLRHVNHHQDFSTPRVGETTV